MYKKIASVLGIVGAVVVLQNWQHVNVQILFWQVGMPQVVLLSIVAGFGFLGGVLYFKAKR